MRVTKIEAQRNSPGRKNIFADDRFLAGVSDETLIRFGLRTGDTIDAGVVKALQEAEELLSARNTALRFLSYRPRTEQEVRDKLREKEFGDAEIAKTLQELAASGLIDDGGFARMYIRNALAVRPSGRILLIRKLLALGVTRPIIDEAIAETMSEDVQRETALKTAEQFLRKARSQETSTDPRKLRQKLASLLLRRGYPWNTVDAVLRAALTIPGQNDEIHE